MQLFTAAQVREMDRHAIQQWGLSAACLMELAGARAADAIHERFPVSGAKVVVACGPGNNGGDGFVAARHLALKGADVKVLRVDPPRILSPESAQNLAILERMELPIHEISDMEALSIAAHWCAQADILVDALFGVGLTRAPSGLFAEVIRIFNDCDGIRAALDIPSGLDADSGNPLGETVRADLTVTFGAPKIGLYAAPGFEWCGETVVADISLAPVIPPDAPRVDLLTENRVAASLPVRSACAHKGDFGHALIWAGSPGKTGAAILCAEAALASGAGLVTVAACADLLPVFMQRFTEIMCETVVPPGQTPKKSDIDAILAASEKKSVLAMGPGLPASPETGKLVAEIVKRSRIPLILDATALFHLDSKPEILKKAKVPVAITPHPGEFARLSGMTAADVQRGRLDHARRMAQRTGAVVVLKGARTVIAAPDGTAAINPTGNPAMATAGSGDVLTGVFAALAAAGMPMFEAACAAAFLHGRAGDLAASEKGVPSLRAGEILSFLPSAFRSLGNDSAC